MPTTVDRRRALEAADRYPPTCSPDSTVDALGPGRIMSSTSSASCSDASALATAHPRVLQQRRSRSQRATVATEGSGTLVAHGDPG